MSQCNACGVDFKAKRSDALYCNDGCRKKAHRLVTDNVTDNPVTDNVTDKTNETNGFPNNPQELYVLINNYPEDTWKDSPEYKELIRRLEQYPLKRLKEENYYIPAWKEFAKKGVKS